MLGQVAAPARRPRRRAAGFTVIEMMVVVMVAAVILALAVPSFRDFIARQRVAAVNAELVTALQLARSEAVARNKNVLITFRTDDLPGQPPMTCYTVHTWGSTGDCDCRNPPGTACFGSDMVEIKTVQVLRATNVTLAPSIANPACVQFEATRGLATWSRYCISSAAGPNDFRVDVQSSINGQLRTQVNPAGRPTVCSPDGSIRGVAACN